MSNRLDKEREERVQPKRMKVAHDAIYALGLEVFLEDHTKIQFYFKGRKVTYYPYSGWASGASIVDGRGLDNLLKQLSKPEEKDEQNWY